jgi:hypothetical protein
MSNIRDTRLTGFAELLFYALPWGDINIDMEAEGWEERWMATIAQRAYDLACHVATQTIQSAHGDMSKIPDMTEWPKEAE